MMIERIKKQNKLFYLQVARKGDMPLADKIDQVPDITVLSVERTKEYSIIKIHFSGTEERLRIVLSLYDIL